VATKARVCLPCWITVTGSPDQQASPVPRSRSQSTVAHHHSVVLRPGSNRTPAGNAQPATWATIHPDAFAALHRGIDTLWCRSRTQKRCPQLLLAENLLTPAKHPGSLSFELFQGGPSSYRGLRSLLCCSRGFRSPVAQGRSRRQWLPPSGRCFVHCCTNAKVS